MNWMDQLDLMSDPSQNESTPVRRRFLGLVIVADALSQPLQIVIGGKGFAITFERRITRSQRDVVAVAYDRGGAPVAQQEMSTSTARGYLDRDTAAQPPDWEELEDLAVDMLKLQ